MADSRWPPVIHSRGYDAYLCGVQLIAGGEETPIYRFPGGQSLVDDSELKKPAEKFHNLMSMVWKEPRELRDKCGLFQQQPVDWYKEIAIHAMKSVTQELGPDRFTHHRTDVAGLDAHIVTKEVFETQNLFDPYSDREFLEKAKKLLPWYIKRYTL